MRWARARTLTESIWIRPIRSTTDWSPRIVGPEPVAGRRRSSPWAHRAMRRASAAETVDLPRGRLATAGSSVTRSLSRLAPTERTNGAQDHSTCAQRFRGESGAARRRHRDVQANHPVAPAPAAVRASGLGRLGIDEEVEVMADQLHLVQGVLDRD